MYQMNSAGNFCTFGRGGPQLLTHPPAVSRLDYEIARLFAGDMKLMHAHRLCQPAPQFQADPS